MTDQHKLHNHAQDRNSELRDDVTGDAQEPVAHDDQKEPETETHTSSSANEIRDLALVSSENQNVTQVPSFSGSDLALVPSESHNVTQVPFYGRVTIATVESLGPHKTLREGSTLFRSGTNEPLGQVMAIHGPESQPSYTLRFNQQSQIPVTSLGTRGSTEGSVQHREEAAGRERQRDTGKRHLSTEEEPEHRRKKKKNVGESSNALVPAVSQRFNHGEGGHIVPLDANINRSRQQYITRRNQDSVRAPQQEMQSQGQQFNQRGYASHYAPPTTSYALSHLDHQMQSQSQSYVSQNQGYGWPLPQFHREGRGQYVQQQFTQGGNAVPDHQMQSQNQGYGWSLPQFHQEERGQGSQNVQPQITQGGNAVLNHQMQSQNQSYASQQQDYSWPLLQFDQEERGLYVQQQFTQGGNAVPERQMQSQNQSSASQQQDYGWSLPQFHQEEGGQYVQQQFTQGGNQNNANQLSSVQQQQPMTITENTGQTQMGFMPDLTHLPAPTMSSVEEMNYRIRHFRGPRQ